MLSGTVMPIADRIKKLKDGMQAHIYKETGSNPKEVTRTIVEKDGQKKGEFVKVGKEVVESSATQDVKTAGIDLSGDCVCTNPTVLAGNMDDDNVVQDKDDVQKEEAIKKSTLQKGLFSGKKTPQPVHYAQFRNQTNDVVHSGHYQSPSAVAKAREKVESVYGKTKAEVKVLPEAAKGVKIEKSAPVGFSFGATLQKVEKFRKCNSLAKADGVTNINTKKTGPAYRGAVTDQKSTEKMRGITQRLRNQMQGKFNVIQGSKQDVKPELKPGLSQQEVAAANNQKVDVNNYKKPTPQEKKPGSSHLKIAPKDSDYAGFNPTGDTDGTVGSTSQRQFDIHMQQQRQQEIGSPAESLRSQPPQLKSISDGNQPEKPKVSPENMKELVAAAKQRIQAKAKAYMEDPKNAIAYSRREPVNEYEANKQHEAQAKPRIGQFGADKGPSAIELAMKQLRDKTKADKQQN